MSLTKISLAISLVLATIIQVASALLAEGGTGLSGAARMVVLASASLSLLCGLGLFRGHLWVGTVFFLWSVGFAMFGIVNEFPSALVLVSLCLALAFWDLARFEQRVGAQVERERLPYLERRHLQLLLLALGAGFVAALATLLIRFKLNFALELILAMALLLGLGQLVRMLQ